MLTDCAVAAWTCLHEPVLHCATLYRTAHVQCITTANEHTSAVQLKQIPSFLKLHVEHCCLTALPVPCRIKLAVGYMLRYSAVALAAKRILDSHDAQPLAVNGRFAGAYSAINKQFW